MEGGFFDRRSHMEKTLNAAIQSAVWNRQWSNTNLEALRDINCLYFLEQHYHLPRRMQLLGGNALYSLIYLAVFSETMDSTSNANDEMEYFRGMLRERGKQAVKQLCGRKRDEFQQFCTQHIKYHALERSKKSTSVVSGG